jgi:PEP-CTERM motif-containing protein
MSRNLLTRSAVLLCAFLGYLCLTARPAFADNIITVNFTGQLTGDTGTTTVTGQYQFDDTTESIGAWSFDLTGFVGDGIHFGPISGASGAVVEDVPGPGSDLLIFGSTFGVNNVGHAVLLTVTDPTDLVSVGGSFDFCPCDESGSAISDFSAITLKKAPVATPEPSSLCLLGAGLLGFGPLVRRFNRL